MVGWSRVSARQGRPIAPALASWPSKDRTWSKILFPSLPWGLGTLLAPVPDFAEQRCPHRIIRVILALRQALPVYPDKQMISEPDWTLGQQRKFVSIYTSDPAARARPYEEAPVHIAE
jgi:hypothetical protein